MIRAETVDEQRLEIPESHASLDRTAGSEGDQQRIGASGGALDLLILAFDALDAHLQLADLLGDGGIERARWLGGCGLLLRYELLCSALRRSRKEDW